MLPQPIEDNEIIRRLSNIRDDTKNDILVYYQFPVTQVPVDGSTMADVATDSDSSVDVFQGLLSDTVRWEDALRAFIGRSILSRCTSVNHPTLFPAYLASVLHENFIQNDLRSSKRTSTRILNAASGAMPSTCSLATGKFSPACFRKDKAPKRKSPSH